MYAAEIEVAQQVKMSMQFEPPVIVRADAFNQIAHVAQRCAGMAQVYGSPIRHRVLQLSPRLLRDVYREA